MVMTLSGASTPGQSGPGSDGNEGVLCISQSSSITGTSPSDCLVSYPLWRVGSYPSTEMLVVYSTAPANCTLGNKIHKMVKEESLNLRKKTRPNVN